MRKTWIDTYLTDPSALFSANLLREEWESMEAHSEEIHEKIRNIFLAHPRHALSWLSIPGIGDITAAILIAFVGDGERFSSANQLRNYIGLIPQKDQSGAVDKQLGVSRHGCMPIRRHIMQGAWGINTFARDCSLTRYWHTLEDRRKIGQKASVGIANKMVFIDFALLKNGETYQMPDGEEYLLKKLRTYKVEALIENPSCKIVFNKSSKAS